MDVNDAEYWPIGNKGATLYLRSDKDAPNRRVIAVDLQNPAADSVEDNRSRAQGGDSKASP